MSKYDSTGFLGDTYDQLLTLLKAAANGEWTASVNTAADDWLGHNIVNIARIGADLNLALQGVIDGIDISNATGFQLDFLVALVGMTRISAAKSTVTLTLTADRATTVTVGTQYGTDAGVSFVTDTELVFAGAGSSTVAATCTVVGEYNADPGDVDILEDATFGITAVTNAAAATPGRLRETASQLKERHTTVVATSGAESASAIYEAVAAVATAAYVFENDTDEIIGVVPANHYYVTAIGGTAADIGEAIANNKTATVSTHGSETVSVYNEVTSQAKDMHYGIAADVDVYVEVTITETAGVYPDDGDEQIKAAIVAKYAEKKIDDDVSYILDHYGPIATVPGATPSLLKIGTAPGPVGVTDIEMTQLQRPVITAANITIL